MKKLFNKFLRVIREILFRNNKHTIRYGLAKGMKRIGGISFLPLNKKDSKEKQFLNKLDLQNKIVYDVGALEGIMTLFFARIVGEGKVVAFEPNPQNFSMIKRNISVNNLTNVLLSNYAIGKKDETIDFIVPKYFRGHGSFINRYQMSKNSFCYKVKVTSVDNLIKKNNYPVPDFIKLDIEGFELFALEGMKSLLQNKKPKLFIEVHEFVENNMNKITEMLLKYNYSIYHIENDVDVHDIKDLKIEGGHLFCE